MTVGEIKNVAAAYMQKSADEFLVNGVDLLLNAMNNAKRRAQLFHDFNAQQVVAQITVSPTIGGALSSAVLYGTATPVRLKDYVTFYLSVAASGGDPAGIVPLYHHSKKGVAVWTKERGYNSRGRINQQDFRYPGDDILRVLGPRQQEIFVYGNKVFFNPEFDTAQTVVIDGLAWMDEYSGDADEDWMTSEGAEYLQWACVCELNYRTLSFVQNLDGNVGPPTKMRDEALQMLVTWDDYQVDLGRQPMGIR